MTQEIGHKPGLTERYAKLDFEAGPTTYSDVSFREKILDATGLKQNKEPLNVADIMSGPGKVGLALREYAPQHKYFFLDLAWQQIETIPSFAGGRLLADALEMPFDEEVLDVVVARYAMKDLTNREQPRALTGVYRSLKEGGIVVIADMVAPNPDVKGWLNAQHSVKQVLGGRRPDTEGVCHIPTEDEWLDLLKGAGFSAEVFDRHMSYVDTTAWLTSRQVDKTQLYILNQMILFAPPEVKEAFNIREEKGQDGESVVKIDYPIIILKATKPFQNLGLSVDDVN